METARLLALGAVQPTDALNSFFRNYGKEAGRTASALALIRTATANPASNADSNKSPLVLVTHQVNITAMTGIFATSGEIIVVKPTAKGIEVVGRLLVD